MEEKQLKYPPDILLWALQKDDYSKEGADFTTTEILKPPQLTYLSTIGAAVANKGYKGFMSLMGNGMHKALENLAPQTAIVEKRLYWAFNIEGEAVVLGGKPDIIHNGVVNDYKNILSTGRPKNNEAKEEHQKQAYINSWLAHKNGIHVDNACVEYIYRDWSPGIAERQKSYPQRANKQIAFWLPKWDEIEKFIIERLTLHVKAKKGERIECTDEERWKRPDAWALKKPKNIKARKLCYSSDEALKELKPGEEIEFRKGACVRCESWCEYSTICPQHNYNPNVI